ncbi:DUF742 domain-containing protein [Streptomyces sp. CNQ085]|uniref:DUF742 domain-containing protein n=1 Tax=Streptomyces sp. CNQ085 TaxID=2886944 RepID=UPI001F50CEDC|nr:DUF742 domain-containing protein [Streptomyces sp. CNQ085]MCI0385706.1 DUF742 domain-containing protein [Streptomyces sp. CNQ085]
MTDRWFDDAAGPVVRPYAMTRGRTRSATGSRIDPVALVIAEEVDGLPDASSGAGPTGDGGTRLPAGGPRDAAAAGGEAAVLGPEHLDIVARCRRAPQPVAELAAVLDLPLGVVRVLVGDLVEAELVRVTRPVPPAELPDERILRDVINGLRAL